MLQIEGLTKRFGPVTVLDGVSLGVGDGEVHALVGENGAGKSTLVRIVTGVYGASAGTMALAGQPLAPRTPLEARRAGINAIHQDRQLAPDMSGLENLFMGLPYARRGGLFVDWAAMRARARRLLDELDIEVPLSRPVRDMSPAEQTMLEIARACLVANRLLVLDEPTASLTDHEARRLFAVMARLKRAGTSFLYVSHRLEEVLRISDRVTVLRNGRVAGAVATREVSKERLIALITGRTDAPTAPRSGAPLLDAPDAPPLLDVRHLATRDGRVVDASLTLRAGEVVGLFGLAGAGRTELVEALYGLRPRRSGEVLLRGARLRRLSPRRGMGARMAMLSEDRGAHGLVARHSVRDNMTLQTIGAYTRLGLVQRRLERRVVRAQIERFAIKTQGEGQLVDTLSGGNQQKVLLARMLLMEPDILLCDEPTRAVDVGTRQLIHRLLIDRARAGCGVLFVSSDLTEVLEVADRVVVMGAGRTVAAAPRGEIDAAEVLRLCYEAEGKRGGAREDAHAG